MVVTLFRPVLSVMRLLSLTATGPFGVPILVSGLKPFWFAQRLYPLGGRGWRPSPPPGEVVDVTKEEKSSLREAQNVSTQLQVPSQAEEKKPSAGFAFNMIRKHGTDTRIHVGATPGVAETECGHINPRKHGETNSAGVTQEDGLSSFKKMSEKSGADDSNLSWKNEAPTEDDLKPERDGFFRWISSESLPSHSSATASTMTPRSCDPPLLRDHDVENLHLYFRTDM